MVFQTHSHNITITTNYTPTTTLTSSIVNSVKLPLESTGGLQLNLILVSDSDSTTTVLGASGTAKSKYYVN